LALIGSLAITATWFHGQAWPTLLSSLVGLLCGGGLIWGIRVMAGYVMGVEAMGFGDVLLMAMIGAFVGWQATLMAIFFAFLSSVAIALSTWIITGKKDLPFGPYLCAGGAIVILGWGDYWPMWVRSFSFLGLLIPIGLAVCILAMGVMLWIIQLFKRLIGIKVD
jgi:prepilin signal peptidase PulO-like enzyme (type II secretory pathway)